MAKSSTHSSPLPCDTRYLFKMCKELENIELPITHPLIRNHPGLFALLSACIDVRYRITGLHSARDISRRPTPPAVCIIPFMHRPIMHRPIMHHPIMHRPIMHHPFRLDKIQCAGMTVALSWLVSPRAAHAALRSGPKTLHSQVMPPRRPSAQIESSGCTGFKFSFLGFGSKVV